MGNEIINQHLIILDVTVFAKALNMAVKLYSERKTWDLLLLPPQKAETLTQEKDTFAEEKLLLRVLNYYVCSHRGKINFTKN
jgi:hypothetical protein